jgi:hypothetical protein
LIEARKLSFQEAWDSSTVFFVDNTLETEIEAQVESLLATAQDPRISDEIEKTPQDIAKFLIEKDDALDILLKDIGLSEEKFKRIVSLLRKLKRIPGSFDSEWSLSAIKNRCSRETNFAGLIANLLVDGKRDKELAQYIPRYYLDMLNYREIKGLSHSRRVRYKDSLIGTYGARKGHRVESTIGEKLEEIKTKYGVIYEKGRSRFIDTDIDFAVPTLEDPWVILMSSFQETTSSGQTNKARDMFSAYERLNRSNSRYNENRAFVNFVDGGGWLARKRDLQRLVEQCHYFVNLQNLDMLDAIVLAHVPNKYFQK